ncbi:MAG: ABC transporter ATP-binding protein [Planctomycetota bacterium]|jgi:ABC-2 type transport system ATP-binding protein
MSSLTIETAVVLQTSGLKRHYGRHPAVDGIDLQVRQGEIYGFLGINGAGKTTTIRMLMGIIAAQAGSITIFCQKTRRTTVSLKRDIGYVSQDQNFYPWMTCEKLGRFVGSFYPTWETKEFFRLLEVFEIPRARKVSQLSGGMKAKLGLALAITPKPKLLILDEPTAGLDPVARRDFLDIIVSQARTASRTTFFSSHLIDEVERCADRIGIIHAGKMRFQGPLSQLREEVRRVRFRGELPSMGPMFEFWQERKKDDQVIQTFRATCSAWQELQLPPEATIESLSLEDIFLACVGSRSLNL